MGKRHKRNPKGEGQPQVKPGWYNPRRLTIGMLEELCKRVPNKKAIVLMSDRSGTDPEACLRAVHVFSGDGPAKPPITLCIAAKFNWTGDDDVPDDEDYIDPTEDTVDTTGAMCELQDCANEEDAGDCVDTPEGVEYMRIPNEPERVEHRIAGPLPKKEGDV